MAFRVGQKVVCVDAKTLASQPGRDWTPEERPSEGDIYTIDGIIDKNCWGSTSLVLAELASKKVGYQISRFRPLVEKKTETGMAILQEILNRESIEDRKPARVR